MLDVCTDINMVMLQCQTECCWSSSDVLKLHVRHGWIAISSVNFTTLYFGWSQLIMRSISLTIEVTNKLKATRLTNYKSD